MPTRAADEGYVPMTSSDSEVFPQPPLDGDTVATKLAAAAARAAALIVPDADISATTTSASDAATTDDVAATTTSDATTTQTEQTPSDAMAVDQVDPFADVEPELRAALRDMSITVPRNSYEDRQLLPSNDPLPISNRDTLTVTFGGSLDLVRRCQLV